MTSYAGDYKDYRWPTLGKDYRWFFRGVQSAIFLYVSCGPCTDRQNKKKRQREAEFSRQARQAQRDADPDANHGVAQTETNPGWQEDIELGPGPPARRVKKQKQKEKQAVPLKRALTDGSHDQGTVEKASHRQRAEAKMEEYKDRLKTLDPAHISEKWHSRRQRRDEEYIDSDDETDDGKGAHFHLRRPSQVGRAKYNRKHYLGRAPPVNDLHPPVVCMPAAQHGERRWMKEKPPSAAFMAGKEGTRTSAPSRSISRASNTPRLRANSSQSVAPSLNRQVTSRAVEERMKRGDVPEMFLMPRSRGSSAATPPPGGISPYLTPENVRVVDYADTSTPDSSLEIQRSGIPRGSRRRRRPSGLRVTADSADESSGAEDSTPTTTASTINSLTIPEPAHDPSKALNNRSRTRHGRLSTILSSHDGNSSAPPSIPTSPSIDPTKTDGCSTSCIGRENTRFESMSPTLSARSIVSSPTASPSASPMPFQARTHSTSITSAPVSPFLGPQLDGDPRSDSKLDQSRPIITVRDSSLDVLQELVSPSSLLNSRLSRQSTASDAKFSSLPEPTAAGSFALDDAEDDDDDGWLWTETGERKWRDRGEARNVRNRWSIDF